MTRKHFQDLAHALMLARPAETPNATVDVVKREAWETCVAAVADVCAKHNGRFDRDQFDRACHAEQYSPAMHGR